MSDYLNMAIQYTSTIDIQVLHYFPIYFQIKQMHGGTVKANRKGMPIINKKLKAGEIKSKASENLLAIKWHDKRDVMLLFTMHTNELAPSDKFDRNTGEKVLKSPF